jgi:hypothetical protein
MCVERRIHLRLTLSKPQKQNSYASANCGIPCALAEPRKASTPDSRIVESAFLTATLNLNDPTI